MSVSQGLLVVSPYALALLTTIVVASIVSLKKENCSFRTYFKLLIFFLPVWALSLVVVLLVPNAADNIVLPSKIISFFVPLLGMVFIAVFNKPRRRTDYDDE